MKKVLGDLPMGGSELLGGSLWKAYHCIFPFPTSEATKYWFNPKNTRYLQIRKESKSQIRLLFPNIKRTCLAQAPKLLKRFTKRNKKIDSVCTQIHLSHKAKKKQQVP